jgi:hypothetical protein
MSLDLLSPWFCGGRRVCLRCLSPALFLFLFLFLFPHSLIPSFPREHPAHGHHRSSETQRAQSYPGRGEQARGFVEAADPAWLLAGVRRVAESW